MVALLIGLTNGVRPSFEFTKVGFPESILLEKKRDFDRSVQNFSTTDEHR
jgi:hypothetical protein